MPLPKLIQPLCSLSLHGSQAANQLLRYQLPAPVRVTFSVNDNPYTMVLDLPNKKPHFHEKCYLRGISQAPISGLVLREATLDASSDPPTVHLLLYTPTLGEVQQITPVHISSSMPDDFNNSHQLLHWLRGQLAIRPPRQEGDESDDLGGDLEQVQQHLAQAQQQPQFAWQMPQPPLMPPASLRGKKVTNAWWVPKCKVQELTSKSAEELVQHKEIGVQLHVVLDGRYAPMKKEALAIKNDKGSFYVKGHGAEARVAFRGKWKVGWHALSSTDPKWRAWGGPGKLEPHAQVQPRAQAHTQATGGSATSALATLANAAATAEEAASAITLYAPPGRILVMELSSEQPRRVAGKRMASDDDDEEEEEGSEGGETNAAAQGNKQARLMCPPPQLQPVPQAYPYYQAFPLQPPGPWVYCYAPPSLAQPGQPQQFQPQQFQPPPQAPSPLQLPKGGTMTGPGVLQGLAGVQAALGAAQALEDADQQRSLLLRALWLVCNLLVGRVPCPAPQDLHLLVKEHMTDDQVSTAVVDLEFALGCLSDDEAGLAQALANLQELLSTYQLQLPATVPAFDSSSEPLTTITTTVECLRAVAADAARLSSTTEGAVNRSNLLKRQACSMWKLLVAASPAAGRLDMEWFHAFRQLPQHKVDLMLVCGLDMVATQLQVCAATGHQEPAMSAVELLRKMVGLKSNDAVTQQSPQVQEAQEAQPQQPPQAGQPQVQKQPQSRL